ncbi:Hypothetical predicted protein [Paramuricea clavata]|uniref:Uncharacterized protein n=1 Tax=Paramuricea clavata TaxID=317549 RepID=A0A7D9HC58_PARCT|nr:Hypothetical predicted protein [Paramuricea clavata]
MAQRITDILEGSDDELEEIMKPDEPTIKKRKIDEEKCGTRLDFQSRLDFQLSKTDEEKCEGGCIRGECVLKNFTEEEKEQYFQGFEKDLSDDEEDQEKITEFFDDDRKLHTPPPHLWGCEQTKTRYSIKKIYFYNRFPF